MFMNKKASAIILVLVIILIVIAVLWVKGIASRECSKDSDCGDRFYCGSDFACHEFQVVEVTNVTNNYLLPSLIVGIALIAAALIMRYKKFEF